MSVLSKKVRYDAHAYFNLEKSYIIMSIYNKVKTSTNESVEIPQINDTDRKRNLGRKVLITAGVLIPTILFAAGSYLMVRNDNMDDFSRLGQFTSPEHQQDRCNTQAAFDSQEKMYEHFQETGGVTEDQAELMGPIVGLHPEEIKGLLDTKLFDMSYDCEVKTASSKEATEGLVLATAGIATTLTLGGSLLYSKLNKKEEDR